MDDAGGTVEVSWKVLGVHSSAFDLSFDTQHLRPGWFDRNQYA